MASSKYKGFLSKKLNTELGIVVSSLRKENAYLKKTLVDLSRQHSEHYKLVEMFLSLETARLENFKLQTTKDKMVLPSEQLSKGASILTDVLNMQRQRIISTCATEIEEIKNKLVNVSTKCQHIKKKVARKKALEKTKQWLEYDQQREAYVREILSRLLWLEKRLNEANQASSQQHNEDHSDEKMRQMQEHYERLLQKAKDELKKEQHDRVSCAVTHPPSQLSRQSPTFSTHSSLLDKSFLECPGCQAEYPASHYRELMNHLEICLN